jgi:hypothetical protein
MHDQIAAAIFQTGIELGNRAPIGSSLIFFNVKAADRYGRIRISDRNT